MEGEDVKLTKIFNPMERKRIEYIILNSNLSTEQVISVLDTASLIDKHGIDPVKFFEAVETVYDEMIQK